MSLPDGEYEIDLAGLVDHPNRNNVALRFSFLPDSFDPTQPLTMYEHGSQIVIASDTTLFEGIGSTRASSNQEYYLTVHDQRVALKHLHNTIRVNKTRQPDKLRQQIRQWDEEKANEQAEAKVAKPAAKPVAKPVAKPAPKTVSKPAPVSAPVAPSRAKSPSKSVSKPSTRPSTKRSSKRPPAPKSDEEIIISDADFDDLDDNTTTTNTQSQNTQSQSQPTQSEPMDVDDEFDDLENQLAEVLEPESKQSTQLALEESDESDFDEVPFSGIAIEGAPEKKASPWNTSTNRASTKPVSLREAMGGDDDESEAE
ncbi:hypothetical protein DIURU_003272 [Diutina rugosa]|uniref:Transcription elongation factor Eaf N-terminal domain-containing protein n=1 Tax=Diutina rugosa TaxID=5481 RepID=A0A642ULX5_DIURU|nr:uncharacterized protein DIURU_003272 [Diutina rugosa]KAA8901420.1 hypothetical protein DIURU_003272 [Diutina rugosa]